MVKFVLTNFCVPRGPRFGGAAGGGSRGTQKFIFVLLARTFHENIFVKASREQKQINFCVPRGPPPAALPNRGPRGTQKLVRTTLTSAVPFFLPGTV